MNGFTKLLQSKRFWVALFGIVGIAVADLGFELSAVVSEAGLALVLALIAAYGAQDVAAAWKGTK